MPYSAAIQPEQKKTSRLSRREALDLWREASLPELMKRADERRLAWHGRRTYFVHSLNLNPTNICRNKCDLCAFWREADHEEAYTLNLAAAEARLRAAAGTGLTDLHVVGGLEPRFDLGYYESLFRTAKSILPDVCIQALTAVEISYLAEQSGRPTRDVLACLKAAGLDAIPGGGAEIFAQSVRSRICREKISADEWLRIHGEAHALGMPSNATMLFGHVESVEDRIEHMACIRDLQDKTGGIAAFIPLPFHPSGTRVGLEQGPSGHELIQTVALARLFLDNIPHIRVLANYVQPKLLETLTYSGVDDLGGTSQDERIAAAAGAPAGHRFVSVDDMFKFAGRLGLEPVLVNSMYQSAETEKKTLFPSQALSHQEPVLTQALEKADTGRRLSAGEAVALHDAAPLHELGKRAHAARTRAVPGDRVTFVVDRNISLTNVCTAGCHFCAFHVKPGSERAFALSVKDVVKEVRRSMEAGATQVLIQGGLNPELSLGFYEELLSEVKRQGSICVHSLSPAEIAYMAEREHMSIEDTLSRLQAAGLDSLPGGGAEILVDEIREEVSPRKLSAEGWIEVMRTAQLLGMRTTATMVFGLGETGTQRVAHLLRIRSLQDETGGFTAFIPWSFQPNCTAIDIPPQTAVDYLRIIALSRLVLDNIPHIQAGWVTEGADVAQLALMYGADDFGGVLMDEQVVKATGTSHRVTRAEVISLIKKAGFRPEQRTTQYEPVRNG